MKPVTNCDAERCLVYRDGILDYEATDAMLESLGYEFLNAPCRCSDGGEFGHLPTCGWGKLDEPRHNPYATSPDEWEGGFADNH